MSADDRPGASPAIRRSGQAIASTSEYVALRDGIIARAAAARNRASRAVNTELVLLYWSVGRAILDEQKRHSWGDDVVGLLAQDLRSTGDLARGFSRRNLFYMRRFAALWPEEGIVPATGGTNRLDPPSRPAGRLRRRRQPLRVVRRQDPREPLVTPPAPGPDRPQAAPALRRRDGQLRRLEIEGRAALAVTKDPYVLDFIDLAEDAKERDLESAPVQEIPRFLRELGVGFAYYGRQQPLEVGGQEFFLDLLFYHHRLRRFIVIDLKIGEFKPEFAGKMALYLNAVDDQLRRGDDAESIGLILCTNDNETVAKFALHRSGAPIAVADWQTNPEVDIADDIPGALRAELAGLPEVRDRLTGHVANAAQRVEARLLEAGQDDDD